MTAQEMKSVATKIDPDTLSEVERISRETGLKNADLLRIGLRKLIETYALSGKIEVGKDAA
jgi:antitoxin component of RelBE/YafQ-DinJ toxin-antitoxin module